MGSRRGFWGAAFPSADLRVGDAAEMPWADDMFKLVVISTVMTSILDAEVRRAVADEVDRVLEPGGAVLWYDFRVDNPANPNVRGIYISESSDAFVAFNTVITTADSWAFQARSGSRGDFEGVLRGREDEDREQQGGGDQQQGQQRRADHSADHGCGDTAHDLGTGATAQHDGQQAGDNSRDGHYDRAQP